MADPLTTTQVVRLLSAEFPDLSPSKVRYLEAEGLLHPRRSKGGYRRFAPDDVERLRLVLKLQKEKFLPLQVIKEKLKSLDKGEITPASLLEEPVESAELRQTLEEIEPLSMTEAVKKSGLTAEQIRILEDFNILTSVDTEKGRSFDQLDIQIMQVARNFFKYGIEPRHLRMYENFVDRETSFFEQILLPILKLHSADRKKKTVEILSDLIRFSSELRNLLLQKSLQKYLRNP
jgi:DNA-binding transcriptional MerR regulator